MRANEKIKCDKKMRFYLYSLSSVIGNESFDCACFLLEAFSRVGSIGSWEWSGLFRDLTGPLDLTGLLDLDLDLDLLSDLEGLLHKALNLL